MELLDSDVDTIIELSYDTTLKDSFEKVLLMDLWLSYHQELPFLAQKAIK